jgi:hypothetical protein
MPCQVTPPAQHVTASTIRLLSIWPCGTPEGYHERPPADGVPPFFDDPTAGEEEEEEEE